MLTLLRPSVPATPPEFPVASPASMLSARPGVSDVAPNLVGSSDRPTPGTPVSPSSAVAPLPNDLLHPRGGVGVCAYLVGSSSSATPTPAAASAPDLRGEAGVDVPAERGAKETSGTPTPAPGTNPLAFAAKGSTTGPDPSSCIVPHVCSFSSAGPHASCSSSSTLPPPSVHHPPASPRLLLPPPDPSPVWEEASAEAGSQFATVAPRAASLGAPRRAVG